MIGNKPVICVSSGSDHLDETKNSSKYYQRGLNCPLAYTDAVRLGGGVPVISGEVCAEELAELCDGLLLTGGPDVEPEQFGEKVLNDTVKCDPPRTAYELALFKAFRAKKKPVLGICRGCQVINIALGGSVYQDLNEQMGYVHFDRDIRHFVTAKEGSILKNLFGEQFKVNSTHHQSCKDMAKGLKVTATSIEGLVEAYEHESEPIIATQFHPERLTGQFNDGRTGDFTPLFTHFVDMCR